MTRSYFLASAFVLATATLATGANAGPKTYTAKFGDMVLTAQSLIVGQTSTATIAGGGNALYLASRPQKNGVVGLLMTLDSGAQFVCSGSLASDRRSIVTAAHCVSDGAGTANPVNTKAIFWNGSDVNQVWFEPNVTAIDVTQYFVNPGYTGEVIDQNDIAVLRLADFAPKWATSYELFTTDIEGLGFNVAGYGRRSNAGGSIGANLGTGRLREGDNIYDYRLGNADFGTNYTDFWGVPFAQAEYSYVSDFDRTGFAANDASNKVANFLGAPLNKYSQTGVGAREVGISGGDSGGPGFVNGKLASVNSWGGSVGIDLGDVDENLNSSWGEFSGYVPIFIHEKFLLSSFVPEPATWGMMIVGFGAVGFAARRQRAAATA